MMNWLRILFGFARLFVCIICRVQVVLSDNEATAQGWRTTPNGSMCGKCLSERGSRNGVR